uniref:PARP catalytic domain-containing protein n=1 Tax=Kalanchoe fedtschenkoi TaxID=63787 RepID=A0A7N0VLP8_KALFE
MDVSASNNDASMGMLVRAYCSSVVSSTSSGDVHMCISNQVYNTQKSLTNWVELFVMTVEDALRKSDSMAIARIRQEVVGTRFDQGGRRCVEKEQFDDVTSGDCVMTIQLKLAGGRPKSWCRSEERLGKRKRELESGNDAVSCLEDAKIKIEVRLADELMLGKRKRELECGNDAVSRLADHVEVGEAGECISDGSQLSSNRRVGRHLLVKRPTAAANDPAARWPNCRPMNAGHRGFETVKRLFLARMRTVDPRAEVRSVHRFAGAIGLARARFFSFKRCAELTAAARSGKSNLVFAWHATSAEGVGRITGYGFTTPNDVTSSYGVGVHLCPVSLPDLSAVDSEPDEYGEKHVILCRVLMGNVEKVDAGSKQCRPRSTSFDNGADNLSNPKRYVVWCANMNTHILPECVLSFRSNGHASSDR